MSERRLLLIPEQPGVRLDKALAAALPELSRAQCQRLIKDGQVTIQGRPLKASQRLEAETTVEVILPEAEEAGPKAEPIPLDIRYEDADIVLINKPAGMVVHPSAGHQQGTLVNAILAHCPDIVGVGGEKRPGIVHRLDKETSGLILVAKNDRSLRFLQDQFRGRTVVKLYLALVEGKFPQRQAIIDAAIGRDPGNRRKMAIIPPGSSSRSREAQTKVTVAKYYSEFTLLECQPLTGRTHQIRVHLAFAGHPIVGDSVYGRRKQRFRLSRHFLHANELTFRRPSDDQLMSFRVEVPPELEQLLEQLI